MARSLRVAPQYIEKVRAALLANGFPRQQDLAEALEISRDRVSAFLNGRPVGYLNFTEICRVLALEWQEIADFGTQECQSPESSDRLDSLAGRLLGYAGLSDIQSAPHIPEPPPRETPPFLFELILQIDFKEQSRQFKEVIELHRAAGFLVHGDRGFGQQFLVNRLLRLKRGWQNQSPIKIDVSYRGVAKNIPTLWRELTDWVGLPKYAQPREILDKVCDRFQTQDVIFIFYTVDYMLPGMLSQWLQEFWEPLVAMAKQNMPKQETHLLMFLVDNCGSVCQSTVRLADGLEHSDYPCIPLRLPPASLFPPDALDEWIDIAIAFREVQFSNGLTSQVLLERSNNGVPQYVYEEICKCWGISWEGVLAKWLI